MMNIGAHCQLSRNQHYCIRQLWQTQMQSAPPLCPSASFFW